MKKNKIKKPKNWIAGALTGKKGALRKTAMRKGLLRNDNEKLSMTDLNKLEKVGGKTAKRAVLAKTFRKFDGGGSVDKSKYQYIIDKIRETETTWESGETFYRANSMMSEDFDKSYKTEVEYYKISIKPLSLTKRIISKASRVKPDHKVTLEVGDIVVFEQEVWSKNGAIVFARKIINEVALNIYEQKPYRFVKFKTGGRVSVGEMEVKVRSLDDNTTSIWTLNELIERINEDNASGGVDYDSTDWVHGFNDTLTEFYSLNDENGKPLNDLTKYAKGGSVVNGFNEDVDKWYDSVAESSGEINSGDNLLKAIIVTDKEATKENLKKLRALIKKIPYLASAKKAIDSQVGKIITGKYKDEFKYTFGGKRNSMSKVSAASSFFSKFNQAATYNLGFANGGGVGNFFSKVKGHAKDVSSTLSGKAKRGYAKAKTYTDNKIKEKKRSIAIDVLQETRNKINNKHDSIFLNEATNIVESKYKKGGLVTASDLVVGDTYKYLHEKNTTVKFKERTDSGTYIFTDTKDGAWIGISEEELASSIAEMKQGGNKMKKSPIMRLKSLIINGEIRTEYLTANLGHKPNYPIQKVGNLVFEKCFLRNYYRLISQ